MESAGLLVRRPHPSDKRLVRIHLTRRGKSLQDEIDEEVQRLTERALRTLGPIERRRLVSWLSEIRQNLGA
jgi:DNA-binding MarR family transcriptional regulator